MTTPGVLASDATTLVPLLLLLVERFASVARSAGENSNRLVCTEPLLTPLNALTGLSDRLTDYWPQLGRINVIHTINVAVLGSAFALVLATERTMVKNVLGFVTVLVWLQLPIFEISQYGNIREEEVVPYSLYWHLAITLVLLGLMTTVPGYEPGQLIQTADIFSGNFGAIVSDGQHFFSLISFVAVALVGVGGYLKLLEWELNKAAENEVLE